MRPCTLDILSNDLEEVIKNNLITLACSKRELFMKVEKDIILEGLKVFCHEEIKPQ